MGAWHGKPLPKARTQEGEGISAFGNGAKRSKESSEPLVDRENANISRSKEERELGFEIRQIEKWC